MKDEKHIMIFFMCIKTLCNFICKYSKYFYHLLQESEYDSPLVCYKLEKRRKDINMQLLADSGLGQRPEFYADSLLQGCRLKISYLSSIILFAVNSVLDTTIKYFHCWGIEITSYQFPSFLGGFSTYTNFGHN